MNTQSLSTVIVEKPFALCKPCLDRGKQSDGAHVVVQEPWCDECFYEGSKDHALKMRKMAAGGAPARMRNRTEQKAETEAVAIPFVPFLAVRVCHRCKGAVELDHYNRVYCEKCSRYAKVVSLARYWLRRWQKKNSHAALRRGVWFVKHYQLTVEDFTRY